MSPGGAFIAVDGELHYRISGYHFLDPFLMTLASDTDLWMFVTSGGGLTAGRVDADGSLFPYDTVDRLHDAHHQTGPITLIRVRRRVEPPILWQPFAGQLDRKARITRNLYKNSIGNRLIFEEIHEDLDLVFRYLWAGCERFGWIRRATLENRGKTQARISLLDGLRNILPHGAPAALYRSASNLVDAYKKAEIDPLSRLGIFSLTAGITDRVEAAEVLRANTVWCHGLQDFRVHLSGEAIRGFRNGASPPTETILNGRRGSYLVSSDLDLCAGKSTSWLLMADSARSHVQVAALRSLILEGRDLSREIEESLKQAGENLLRSVGSADGLQMSEHTESSVHHFANVLFNNMRGGVFRKNHDIPTIDLRGFVNVRNRGVGKRHADFLSALPTEMPLNRLLVDANRTGDSDLRRLCYEYLPLYFGRRHGDPSRPWNQFSIQVRDRSGGEALHYEGNWRDIFQNWEALCTVFPGFLPNIVAKFVNASTVDGFNPYRITRSGVDWEKPDHEDPWSNIGYWGDHQIIYLLKFLEAMADYAPGELEDMLHWEIFSYANVPYRIRPYAEIVQDPHSTIDYDFDLASRIDERVRDMGTDGRLLQGSDDAVYHVNLLEKLLVPVLSKLSNLVVDGGIWMNTQRPEWNDANNALVGNGISVVTLCYLRRYLHFFEGLLAGATNAPISVSTEVADWFAGIRDVLHENLPLLNAETIDDAGRKRILDELGLVFSAYRNRVYRSGFSDKRALELAEITEFCRITKVYLDRGIRANRRTDGLYNSYNLLDLSTDPRKASIQPLQEMLEGQVAALSSGLLGASEALQILLALFESSLYRPDQHSFLLYPEADLPGFLEKNCVPEHKARAIPLLSALLDAGDTSIIDRDASGICRFAPDFRNAADLTAALYELSVEIDPAILMRDRESVLALFEDTFGHGSYTGRSGAMYAYEGLGSIYWHMVAKLLVAVQEIVLRAEREGQAESTRRDLAEIYYRIRSGLGFEKSVSEYGAFPTDPYSHTPPHGGAKQPGMTGQVKEEILTRFGELGVRVENGAVRFRPILLRAAEFLRQPRRFQYYDQEGEPQTMGLKAGSLAFTFCQVPVVYEQVAGGAWLKVEYADGLVAEAPGNLLNQTASQALLERAGRIKSIQVGIPERDLYQA